MLGSGETFCWPFRFACHDEQKSKKNWLFIIVFVLLFTVSVSRMVESFFVIVFGFSSMFVWPITFQTGLANPLSKTADQRDENILIKMRKSDCNVKNLNNETLEKKSSEFLINETFSCNIATRKRAPAEKLSSFFLFQPTWPTISAIYSIPLVMLLVFRSRFLELTLFTVIVGGFFHSPHVRVFVYVFEKTVKNLLI